MKTNTGVDISSAGDVAIVSFQSACISGVEEISSASAQIREYVHRQKPQRMVFDFSGVKFFSSQVLGLLLEARAHLQSEHGRVVICALDAQLHRVFKITNLDRIFTFHPDRKTALSESAEQR